MGCSFLPVKPTRIQTSILWITAGIAAALAGIPVGQEIRSSLSAELSKSQREAHESHTASSASTQATSAGSASEANLSDDAIEAELSNLLGALSRTGGSRPAAEVMNAISAANDEKSDLQRYLLIYEAVSELGRNDFEAALSRARKENNHIAQRALERRWAEVDPLGAAKAWATGAEKLVSDSFFSSWVKINPSGALTWFSALEDGPQKQKARELVLDRVAKYDPQRSLDFANQIADEKDRNALVSRSLKTVAGSDIPQAVLLARSLPEGATRDIALDTVVTQLASTDLAAAQKLIAENPAASFSQAAASVAAGLLKQSPDQAMAWANTLADGTARDAAYAGIAKEWAIRDVNAAAAWLDTLPSGANKNAAVTSFAGRNAARDPEGATLWASTLPAGESRTRLLTLTVGNWQRTNPIAAQQWIETADFLSAAEKEGLLNRNNTSKLSRERSKALDKSSPKK